ISSRDWSSDVCSSDLARDNSAGAIPVAEMLGAIAAGGPAAAPPILFPYTVANAPASQCALILGLKGPNLTIAQKECSSASAIAKIGRASCRERVQGRT